MKKPIKKKATLEELEERKSDVFNEKVQQAQARIEENRTWWNSKTKSQKTSFVISCVIFGLVVVMLFLWVYAGDLFGEEMAKLAYGFKEDGTTLYKNGWEFLGAKIGSTANAWLVTLFALALAFFFTFLCNFIIGLFTWKGKRSKTIGSLAKSLVRYIVILITIAIILTAWGVNVASIVASLGVLTLIIGLGCQTLINDVVAGLFVVIDDFYDVGDIVIIDGFRGVVTEIGLKSTKLKDDGGNIKAINNSQITTVTNLTREPSLITVSIGASYNEDVNHVEAVIAKELPKIKDKIPALISGPTYRGIKGFDDAAVEYFFIATCPEENRFQTTRDLNRELYLMFVENDITIPYNQIVVNPPDPQKEKASEEEKKIAAKLNASYRKISKAEDKKNILQKARDSLEKAAKEQ